MVSSSKERLGVGDVSNLFDGKEFAEKLIDSDSRPWPGTYIFGRR